MSKLVWKYRSYPGPTASHLWGPDDTHSLCGKMKRSIGTWKVTKHPEGRCMLCQRRETRSQEMLQMVLGGEQENEQQRLRRLEKQRQDFALTDDSRMKALAVLRAGMAMAPEPITRDTALAAVLSLAVIAVDTKVTWTQLQKALRKEYDLAVQRSRK